jgi:hypothetical protein
MAGITGLGTTYNLPNYTGALYSLTPSDTPLFSAIGGLTGGRQATSVEFEWQTSDLRAAAQPAVLEGADAPTAQERVRANVTNVCQIHQEKVSVSYTKLAAYGQKGGTNNAAQNPITNELDWQSQEMLKQMVRDVEYSFIQGSYQKPSDNSTARKTRGLLSAISTNALNATSIAGTAAVTGISVDPSTDVATKTSHGFVEGDTVVINSGLSNVTGVTANTPYYVKYLTANTFSLALTKGGTAINLGGTTDASVSMTKQTKLTIGLLEQAMQGAYDNGGLMEGDTRTLIVPSAQKIVLSDIYANAYGKFQETSRNVGGVDVTSIETNFGRLNVMIDRFVPSGTVILASLEQLAPVFLEIPEKGHFFAEPLAKTGASENVQFYGEVGLAYGNEKAHAKIEGLALPV